MQDGQVGVACELRSGKMVTATVPAPLIPRSTAETAKISLIPIDEFERSAPADLLSVDKEANPHGFHMNRLAHELSLRQKYGDGSRDFYLICAMWRYHCRDLATRHYEVSDSVSTVQLYASLSTSGCVLLILLVPIHGVLLVLLV